MVISYFLLYCKKDFSAVINSIEDPGKKLNERTGMVLMVASR